ncbi:MAG: nitrilase family protein [Thermoleophilia bacterium]
MTRITVTCVQMEPRVGEVESNRAATVRAIEQACAHGARLVVLPELAVSGYVFRSSDEARACAEPADGPTLKAWLEAARRCNAVVVGGFAEQAGGSLYNSAAVVAPQGVLAVYRKLHLWGFENDFFTPGADPPPVVDTPVGRIGVAVCYDLWFPEVARLLALGGAELMALPTNWPEDRVPAGERPMEVNLVMAAAHVNRMAVAAADRCGTERGLRFLGWSLIVDAWGWPAAPFAGGGPQLVTAAVDLAVSRDKSWGRYNDILGDRRPEVYG